MLPHCMLWYCKQPTLVKSAAKDYGRGFIRSKVSQNCTGINFHLHKQQSIRRRSSSAASLDLNSWCTAIKIARWERKKGHKQNTQNSPHRALCFPPSNVLYGHHIIRQLCTEDGRKFPTPGKEQDEKKSAGFKSNRIQLFNLSVLSTDKYFRFLPLFF